MNAFVKVKDQPIDAADNATNKLLSIVSEKSQTAQAELEHLIEELQQLRQSMDDKGKRVQQQITEFASLGQSTLEFANLVRDGASNVEDSRQILRFPGQVDMTTDGTK
jgi:flagellar biosynthesis chaperone FliJ